MSTILTALQKQRYDAAANWTAANPTLLAGELGIESDTGYFKIGDGSTAWNSLAYVPGSKISAYPIVNADVAAGAEIAVSKLADGSARQLLQTDAAGTGVEWASNIDIPGTLEVTNAATFDNNVTIEGDLTVNGTTTTIDTTTLVVEDKNIEMGVVDTPSDVTADGGGITLKGATDKTINWIDATDAWTFSEHIDLASAKEFRIAGTKVLDATSLGSAVVSSSLTSVGIIGTGTWQGDAIDAAYLDATVVTTSDTGTVTSAMIENGTIVDGDINASAAIADTKLDTISTAGKVSNSATTATDANTASAIVARDASGDFSAGTITADLTGNANTATALSSSRTFAVTGDVTGTVSSDLTSGASIATSIATGAILNDDVNASAAIAGTKIDPDFGSQTVETTGDLAINTNVLFVDSSESKVGIGTTSPSELITGRGNIFLETNSTSADSGAGVFWQSTTSGWTTSGAHAAIYGKRVDANNGYLRFDTRSGGTTDERARIDSSGNVGIGTTSVNAPLHVSNGGAAGLEFYPASYEIQAYNRSTSAYGLARYNAAGHQFAVSGTEAARIDSSGRLLVGTIASPAYQLQVSTDSAGKPSTNTWTIVSDERIKEDIELADLDICYEAIKNIPLKRFKWKDEVYTEEQVPDRHKLGWIAQDVESVFPKAVRIHEFKYNQVFEETVVPAVEEEFDEDGNVITPAQPERIEKGELVSEDVIEDCRDLNADQLYAAMYGAIQKLIAKVEALESELLALKSA